MNSPVTRPRRKLALARTTNRRTVHSILVAYAAGIVRGGAKWQAVVNLKLFEVQAHVEIQGTPQPETPNPELSWHCYTSAPRAAVQNRSQTLTIAGGAAGATREFLHQTMGVLLH